MVIDEISKEDVASLQNLPEADKMDIFFESIFYTYQTPSLFSLVVVGLNDVLAMGSPSK